jgi:hypothetical protein
VKRRLVERGGRSLSRTASRRRTPGLDGMTVVDSGRRRYRTRAVACRQVLEIFFSASLSPTPATSF